MRKEYNYLTLSYECGITAKKDAGDKCHTDTRDDEQLERCITPSLQARVIGKLTSALEEFKGEYLINLVDSIPSC